MYFIRREGRYLDLTASPLPFRRYLREGWQGQRATLGDWDLHLSTIFTEVRLRPQIELRSADSLPPRHSLAVAALAKGLLYDQGSLEDAAALLHREVFQELPRVFADSWRLGLQTPTRGRSLRELSLDLLALARDGLRRQRVADSRGLDETLYLEGIDDLAQSGETLAQRLLAHWQGTRRDKVRVLLAHCGFAGNLNSGA